MRIVLTGATGFLGHYLLPSLSAAGHECVALSRYAPACRDLAVVPGVRVVQTDVYDSGRIEEYVAGADAVINMAGILNEHGRKGEGFRRVHVDLPALLISACQNNGVRRFMHVSALGAGKGQSHYLVSKGQAEDLIFAADGIDATIVQPSVIFGEGDEFFNRFATLLRVAPVLPLACPDARMQPVWAGDVAKLLTLAIEDKETIRQTLVAVGPRSYSLRDLVAFTAATADLKRRIVGLPDGLSRLQGRVMDFVPGKPFSSDNYRSLQTNNTSEVNSLWRFGIRPRSIESTVSAYLGGSARQSRLNRCRQRVRH